jgi:putative ABC transport system permease protein
MPRTPLAWSNLSHDRVRFLLFVLGVVFAVVLMFMQIGFRNALLDSNTLFIEKLNADLILVSPNREPIALREPFSRHRLTQARSVPGVREVEPIYFENALGVMRNTHELLDRRGPNRTIRVIGIEPGSRALDIPELDPANPNYVGDRIKLPGTALYDRYSKAGDRPGESVFGPLKEGITTELAGQGITLVGEFTLGPDFTTEGTLVVSQQTFADVLRRPYTLGAPLAEVDFGLVRLEPGADLPSVQQAIRQAITSGVQEADVDVLSGAEFISREKTFWLNNTPIGFAFKFGMFMGFAVGMVICYQILSGDVSDHLSEYATLKAIGYDNWYLAWVVIQESLILAIGGYSVGIVIAYGAYRWLTDMSGMPLRMTLEVAGLVLVVTVSMCIISGLIALVKMIRADPADVF